MSTEDKKPKNYVHDFQQAVYERLQNYDPSLVSPSDLYINYMHIRYVISLKLKKDTGKGLVKGNVVLSEECFNTCLKYLDNILPL